MICHPYCQAKVPAAWIYSIQLEFLPPQLHLLLPVHSACHLSSKTYFEWNGLLVFFGCLFHCSTLNPHTTKRHFLSGRIVIAVEVIDYKICYSICDNTAFETGLALFPLNQIKRSRHSGSFCLATATPRSFSSLWSNRDQHGEPGSRRWSLRFLKFWGDALVFRTWMLLWVQHSVQ